jgi:pilus assembly protein CpaB
MNLRAIVLLLLSLALAGVAAVSANRWMSQRLAGSGADGELTDVVAAAAEIPFGTKLDATMIKLVGLPPESVPEAAFLEPEDVIDRVAAYTLFKDEILLEGRVVEHIGGSALAAVVAEGKRAVTVRVNDVAGVAGFLLPGNRVDVIATRRSSGSGRGTEARTLVQNLKVLAVDQTTSPDKNDPVVVRAVTLEADPAEAEEIARATEEGNVRLVLRNPLDGTRRAPRSEPEGDEEPVASEPQEPSPPRIDRSRVVEVIRGTALSTTTFESKNQAAVDFAR